MKVLAKQALPNVGEDLMDKLVNIGYEYCTSIKKSVSPQILTKTFETEWIREEWVVTKKETKRLLKLKTRFWTFITSFKNFGQITLKGFLFARIQKGLKIVNFTTL